MAGIKKDQLVFGLDIGTRSIVGTVGYKDGNRFVVAAQCVKEHETRAMLDGQIHDIKKVGTTIAEVKECLEKELDTKLYGVCIAAAGRVLRTITTHVDMQFSEEKNISTEDMYALSAKGVEKAYSEFTPANNTGLKFYCVGYTVIRYYMNEYPILTPEEHKASSIGADMIVTFLPEDVVDGLFKAVELAGLKAVNMTLEPIAAIQVAIPEKFRMLNIALVDVGAGTSDISITKEGAIVAYGMIPVAGDSLTEIIAQHCLVDFNTAEEIKRQIENGGDISYIDIMGLPQSVNSDELLTLLKPQIESMTKPVADCIRELNGDKPVSAVFVVGGGGKIPGYTRALSEELGIIKERVAIRGGDVMGFVDFPDYVKQDSLLVTPVGICLSYYEQINNLVIVTFNEQRIKVYDNGKLSVVDAAMQAEFPNEDLFPKRGPSLEYTLDGKSRMKRGMPGESAIIMVNGNPADIHTPIKANDVILVMPSTAGEAATQTIGALPEFQQNISFKINGKNVSLPKYAVVNGEIKSAYYEICSGDVIEMQNEYPVKEIFELLDIDLKTCKDLRVNNEPANGDSKVFENFFITFTEGETEESDSVSESTFAEEVLQEDVVQQNVEQPEPDKPESAQEKQDQENPTETVCEEEPIVHDIYVDVNGKLITLKGKASYVYVDVFDYIDFDLNNPKGSGIQTDLNGEPAEYLKEIFTGDKIDIRWKD